MYDAIGRRMSLAEVSDVLNYELSTEFLEEGAYTFVISKEGYVTQTFYEPIIGWIRSYMPRLELEREEK